MRTATKKRGRPKREVSDQDLRTIESMAGLGATRKQIAIALGVSKSTIDRWTQLEEVSEAYQRGRVVAMHTIAQSLFDKALSGDTTAAIFYLKAQAGWTDKPQPEPDTGAQVVVYLPENGR